MIYLKKEKKTNDVKEKKTTYTFIRISQSLIDVLIYS